jgi:hypothetical protein
MFGKLPEISRITSDQSCEEVDPCLPKEWELLTDDGFKAVMVRQGEGRTVLKRFLHHTFDANKMGPQHRQREIRLKL